MDEIAAVAKVSKQTVYKHFTDKETLFIEIITADMASRSQELARTLDHEDPDGNLYQLVAVTCRSSSSRKS